MTNPSPQQPGDPSQYGQQPLAVQPPKKKRRKWPWILGAVIVLIIAISALSNGGGDSGNKEASNNGTGGATTGVKSSKDAPAGLNTPVRDGKFEFVVTVVQPGVAEVGDNPYLAKKAQGQFVIVSMSAKNIGDKPQSFAPSAQKLFDAEGRSFESDTGAQIALGSSDIPVWDNINPGNSVEAKVIYDMPQDAVPTTIELHDSMFSGGVKVSLTS